MDAEVLLASSYAGFLVIVSGTLEAIARYVHRRAQNSSTQGFTYLPDRDLWQCPNGKPLHREGVDETFRIVRYRAHPHHCNHCSIKFRCTDSASGRVLEHPQESWLESGMRKFHRGISLTLLLLAAMILSIEIVRHHQREEQAILAALVLCLGIAGMRVLNAFRSGS